MESVARHSRASYKSPSSWSRCTHQAQSSLSPNCTNRASVCATSWSRAHLCCASATPSSGYSYCTMEWPVAAARDGQVPRQLPPGFRFHPTDEELVVQYLRRKALSRPLPAAVIPVVHDVAGLDPWDLPGAREGEGYFFSLRRAPAAGGGRRRRACSGYWKATGKAKPVFLQGSGCGSKRYLVGVKTALAFHRGEPSRAPSSSSRTGWVMYEYRLAVPEQRKPATHGSAVHPGPGDWVVCRIFLKSSASRPSWDTAGETPGNLASSVAPPRERLLLPSSPQASSSSSCVTGVAESSDLDEVNSGK